MTVGKPIVVGEVLSKSVGILTGNPVLLLPPVIALIPGLLGDLVPRAPFPLSALTVITGIASFVVAVIVSGAYPFMVQAVVGDGQLSIAYAMGEAYHKFWTLLGAGILVALIVVLGFVALIVPGIILLTWYAYTVPAIMLEDKGATEGMAASKAFGRDKKWSTFVIFLIVGVVALLIGVLQQLFSFGGLLLLGQVVSQILFVPVSAWVSVIIAYTYISCGPSSVPVATETLGHGMAPSAPTMQPSMRTGGSSNLFCMACGSPIEPGAKFCRNCGKAV